VRRLGRSPTVALVVAGTAVATAASAATDSTGPLGPAGIFSALVLLVTAFSGITPGLITAAFGGIVIGVGFTGDARGVADLLAYLLTTLLVVIIVTRLVEARETAQTALAQVDSMVRNAPIGMAFVDNDLRFVEINDTLARLNGRPVADHIGRRVDELDGLRDTPIPGLIEQVLRTGRSVLDVPFTGADVRVSAGYYPVRGADHVISGVGIVVREVTAEHERDLLFDRVTRLQELTTALSTTGTVGEVVDTAVRSLQHAVSARAVSFCRVDDDTVVVEGSIGYDEEIASQWTSFALDADVPIADAIRTGRPVLCDTMRDAVTRYPHLASSLTVDESNAIVAVPLRGESSVFGAIGISFTEEHSFDRDQESFLLAAATQAATAYERAAAFEAERTARRAAEAANRRLAYLSEATAVLSQSLEPETTMQRLADLAVPTLSDWCAVHIVEGDYAYPVAMASENPDLTAAVRDLSERHPVPINAPAGLGAVVRSGEPIVLRRVTMDAVRAATDETEVVDLLSRLRSIAIVPMSFAGKVVGTVTLSNTTDRDLDDAIVALAGELAARAAQAITNARLYQERNSVAETLQASLMPPSTPMVPGIDLATRFVPASQGLDVGGDFYDVLRLGTVDDPAPTWALVIGDVRGKGADAAAITGIARATIRAAALDETSPARMLEKLNQVLLAAAQDDRFATETGEPRFCTACVITVTPTADCAELVVAVGGHPLPFLLRRDGALDQVGTPGGLIGVMGDPGITDVRMRLGPGDALVLFTDGVTERHAGRDFFDEEGLRRVLTTCSHLDAGDIAERVGVASREYVPNEPKDDMAILVARVSVLTGVGRPSRMTLPSTDRAAALARRFVRASLVEMDARHLLDTAALLASELVTNALLHGDGVISIEILAVIDGVRVAVADAHPDLPVRRTASSDDEHGRGLLLVEKLAERWGVDADPPGKSVWFELRR
jgi:serine phosphatase RsbU (regulator of sigma subunit)/PAS domain-containing protein/anti-sigma regulatory factor (Ser/Thr protein kinase)